jgi:hypothetical protein
MRLVTHAHTALLRRLTHSRSVTALLCDSVARAPNYVWLVAVEAVDAPAYARPDLAVWETPVAYANLVVCTDVSFWRAATGCVAGVHLRR